MYLKADEIHASHPQGSAPGPDGVPFADPNWNYNAPDGMARHARFLEALISSMRKGIRIPVNYEKLREITQEKDENPASSYSQLENIPTWILLLQQDRFFWGKVLLVSQHLVSDANFRSYK